MTPLVFAQSFQCLACLNLLSLVVDNIKKQIMMSKLLRITYLKNDFSIARLCLYLHKDKPNKQYYLSEIYEVIFKCHIKYISKVYKTFKAIFKKEEIIHQWAACCTQKEQIFSCNNFLLPSESNISNIYFTLFMFSKDFCKMYTH